MNYPEELREKYNECMYDERDLIENFLNDTADLSMGNQMFEWTLEPMPKLLGHDGKKYEVREIALDPNKFVVFLTTSGGCKFVWRECTFFAYGELSKIIEMLPEPNEFTFNNKLSDIGHLANSYDVNAILAESPFNYNDENLFELGKDVCSTIVGLHNNDVKFATALRNHIRVQILRKSEQYKKLKEIISKNEGGAYNFCEYNTFLAVFITPDGTDMHLPVCDVSFENGQLNVLVAINGTRLGDETGNEEINLVEKDLTPANLDAIIKFFEEEVYSDIMDTYNAHNPELVRKINAAWKNKKYHDKFEGILHALLERDYEEYCDKFEVPEATTSDYAMSHAYEIIEGVCDDWDLETILSFIRYKED